MCNCGNYDQITTDCCNTHKCVCQIITVEDFYTECANGCAITIITNEPMDGRPWQIHQYGPGYYITRLNEDGTQTTIATANDENSAVAFIRSAMLQSC